MHVACAEKFAMKRLLFVTAMMILTVAAVSGCRGVECSKLVQPRCGVRAVCASVHGRVPARLRSVVRPGVPMGTTTTTIPSTVPPTMEALPAN